MAPAIGIFSRTFSRPTLDGVLDAITGQGLGHVHFNFSSACLPSLPETIDQRLCAGIRDAFDARGLVMTSVSGTFNAIHPDVDYRESYTQRVCGLIQSCSQLGTSLVSLCTGTRDPDNMWRRHPANDDADSWRDLLATIRRLLPAAEKHNVFLGIEPETNNVVDSAAKARRLLDEIGSPHLKIVFDGANLIPDGLPCSPVILESAFELLSADIVLVHAKERAKGMQQGCHGLGRGVLDWTAYCRLLREYGYTGPVILHNLEEADVADSIAFLTDRLTAESAFHLG